MKALQITGIDQYQIIDVEIPKIGDHQVLVEIKLVATCPRWDMNMLGGKDMFNLSQPPAYPLLPGNPGHEAAGVVAAVGAGVERLKIGDRVAAIKDIEGNGAYAQYLAYREDDLLKLPEALSFKQAVSFELLKCVIIGLLQFGDLRGKSILIGGVGPAGILAMQIARIWGASRVLGIDLSEKRIAQVQKLGIGEVVHLDKLGGERFDYGYDCVGHASSVQNVLDHTDYHVVIFGVLRGEVKYSEKLWFKGTKLESYNNGYRPFNEADRKLLLDLVMNKGLNTECLQTSELPFTEYDQAVKLLASQDAIKICFSPETGFGV